MEFFFCSLAVQNIPYDLERNSISNCHNHSKQCHMIKLYIFNLYQFNVSFKSFSFSTNIVQAQKHKRSSDLKVRKPF